MKSLKIKIICEAINKQLKIDHWRQTKSAKLQNLPNNGHSKYKRNSLNFTCHTDI